MDVENEVDSDSFDITFACEGDEHGYGFDAHKIPVLRVQIKVEDEPADVLGKIIGTGTNPW